MKSKCNHIVFVFFVQISGKVQQSDMDKSSWQQRTLWIWPRWTSNLWY